MDFTHDDFVASVFKTKAIVVHTDCKGSAVAAVPALTKNFAYLSSGTWSLMGIETDKPIINAQT